MGSISRRYTQEVFLKSMEDISGWYMTFQNLQRGAKSFTWWNIPLKRILCGLLIPVMHLIRCCIVLQLCDVFTHSLPSDTVISFFLVQTKSLQQCPSSRLGNNVSYWWVKLKICHLLVWWTNKLPSLLYTTFLQRSYSRFCGISRLCHYLKLHTHISIRAWWPIHLRIT